MFGTQRCQAEYLGTRSQTWDDQNELNPIQNFKPLSIFFGMHKVVLFKFGKWIHYSKSERNVKISSRKGRGLGHVTL